MDGKVYTDCTADKKLIKKFIQFIFINFFLTIIYSPDGKMEDHEWCYVAPG